MVAAPGGLVRASDNQILWALKTVDESVTSSTTLQNDDTLLHPVEASTTYEFEALLALTGNVTGDFKMAFTFPAASTCYWGAVGPSSADAGFGTAGSAQLAATFGSASGTAVAYSGSTTAVVILVKGVLVVSTTPGNLQLQWAQNTSNGTATVVKAGSYLRAAKRS